MPFSPRYLQQMVNVLPKYSIFCVSGIGPSQLEANVAALLLGGHARVGLEDNLYYRQGELATNVQLTERIVRVIRELDMEPPISAEAREMWGYHDLGETCPCSPQPSRLLKYLAPKRVPASAIQRFRPLGHGFEGFKAHSRLNSIRTGARCTPLSLI